MTRRRFWIPLTLAVLTFVVQCRGTMGCADSMWSVPTAVSIWDHGDANLDEYLPIVRARLNNFVEWHRGHVYTMFPIGTSILIAPAVPVMRLLARMVIRGDADRLHALEAWQQQTGCPAVLGEPIIGVSSITELILASAIVAATTAVMFAVAQAEGLSIAGACIIALIFAFATSAWSTASRSLWQHGPSMLVLSVALLLQVRRRWLPATGALLAFSYMIRPTDSIPMATGSAWVALTRRRQIVPFALAAAAVLGVFVVINLRTYGAILPPYYRPQRLGASATFVEALLGDMISPARGLLIFSPILAFGVFGAALKLRARTFRALDASLAACILLHWVAIASFPHWWGGDSYGPRFFTDLLPYMVYFLIPVVGWLLSATGARRAAVAVAFAAAALFSVFVNAEGALIRSALMWDAIPVTVDAHPERIWDWRDPQFLAGVRRP